MSGLRALRLCEKLLYLRTRYPEWLAGRVPLRETLLPYTSVICIIFAAK